MLVTLLAGMSQIAIATGAGSILFWDYKVLGLWGNLVVWMTELVGIIPCTQVKPVISSIDI